MPKTANTEAPRPRSMDASIGLQLDRIISVKGTYFVIKHLVETEPLDNLVQVLEKCIKEKVKPKPKKRLPKPTIIDNPN